MNTDNVGYTTRGKLLREARHIIDVANRGGMFDECKTIGQAKELAYSVLAGKYPVKVRCRTSAGWVERRSGYYLNTGDIGGESFLIPLRAPRESEHRVFAFTLKLLPAKRKRPVWDGGASCRQR